MIEEQLRVNDELDFFITNNSLQQRLFIPRWIEHSLIFLQEINNFASPTACLTDQVVHQEVVRRISSSPESISLVNCP